MIALKQDGRQSDMAQNVSRGTFRLLHQLGIAGLPEMPLPSGRRADILGLKSDTGIIIVEIKSSIADFRSDEKWPAYRAYCDQLYFAIPQTLPIDIMPPETGLIVADAYGAALIREAPLHKIAPATRRALMLRFARTAAQRLQELYDPAAFTQANAFLSL
jgi:hypothetical protein